MLGPTDEFPIHQIPQPISWPGSSDRNFYDRSYFNAHDRTGDIFLISGIGYYPNLGVKDAFVLVRRGARPTPPAPSRPGHPGLPQPKPTPLPAAGDETPPRAPAVPRRAPGRAPRLTPNRPFGGG